MTESVLLRALDVVIGVLVGVLVGVALVVLR